MFFRRQAISRIDVSSKLLFVKLYDDSIKILQFTNFFSIQNHHTSIRIIRFVFSNSISSNFEFRKNSNIKKRQSLKSFFDIINRDFFVFRITFVSITIIESKKSSDENNRLVDRRTKQNINNFNHFDNFINFIFIT